MITTFFIFLATKGIDLIAFILPDWFIQLDIMLGFEYIIELVVSFDGILPMKAILTVLYTILWFHIIRITYNVVNGVLSLVRGGGGHQM